MADQKRITLRSGHASPKTIVLYELPVADASTGTTIVLYEGHATAKTVVLRNPADIPVAGGTVSISLSVTEGQDTFAGAAGLSAEIALAATEASDVFAGTISAVASVSLAATEAPDTFAATVEAEEAVVEEPAAGGGPVASGGTGFDSDRKKRRPDPPKHLTAMVFSNDPPEDLKSDERDLAAAHTAAEDGVAALPSSAPLSGDAARAIASGMAVEAAAAVLGPMPARVANDDEEAMMIILALAA